MAGDIFLLACFVAVAQEDYGGGRQDEKARKCEPFLLYLFL
jgi:hypothetical protein